MRMRHHSYASTLPQLVSLRCIQSSFLEPTTKCLSDSVVGVHIIPRPPRFVSLIVLVRPELLPATESQQLRQLTIQCQIDRDSKVGAQEVPHRLDTGSGDGC